MPKVQRALLSVSDKVGLIEFARALAQRDVELVSSGGTARVLREAGIRVTEVSEYTGAPEILDGRVKTLHPRVFGGILARDTADHQRQLDEHGIPRIDLVVVNLYPFEKTVGRAEVGLAEAVEQIDIGGPSLVRAAAKNHERVAVVVSPADYQLVIEQFDERGGTIDDDVRLRLAGRAFAYTAAYDAAISNFWQSQLHPDDAWPPVLSAQFARLQGLRYGENPHQSGAFFGVTRESGVAPSMPFEQLQGKELSYNNIMDADAAWALARELPPAAVCVIKHANPCGAAVAASGDVAESFASALATDPVSAFGGIVACHGAVSAALAERLRDIFLEAVIAPDYDARARELLARKKNLRLLRVDSHAYEQAAQAPSWRAALGGVLLQQQDRSNEQIADCPVPTARRPDARQLADLQFAWVVCKHVKSNAIVFCKNQQLVGVGAGQMSRVDAVRLAVTKAQLPLEGSVLASDAFFPFRDGVDEAAKAGVAAIVQPGGSVRDDEVISAADAHGLAMVFTGVRHFRH